MATVASPQCVVCKQPTTTTCGVCLAKGKGVALCHDRDGCVATHAREAMGSAFHPVPEQRRRGPLTYGHIARVTQVGGHRG